MPSIGRLVLALAVLSLLRIAGPASAQIPDEFTNLEVLPKDVSKRELVGIMREFSLALGVRCKHCHVGESTTSLEGYDFASDDKEHKRVARLMMRMTNDINSTHLAKLGRDNVTRVRCFTCHHGVDEPERIEDIVLEVVAKDGVPAAMEKYRELRGEYYGSASYDFGAGPLNKVAETLAREHHDAAGAIDVAKVNIEFNPDESSTHLLLGQLYQATGDRAAAIAAVEKSLELDPENEWAKGILEKLKASE
jgi:tetratricopeptide (TPR) repeat protein